MGFTTKNLGRKQPALFWPLGDVSREKDRKKQAFNPHPNFPLIHQVPILKHHSS